MTALEQHAILEVIENATQEQALRFRDGLLQITRAIEDMHHLRYSAPTRKQITAGEGHIIRPPRLMSLPIAVGYLVGAGVLNYHEYEGFLESLPSDMQTWGELHDAIKYKRIAQTTAVQKLRQLIK